MMMLHRKIVAQTYISINYPTLKGGMKYKTQLGFNLIELMVSTTIGLIILASLSALYLNITSSNSEMAKTNLQIENGRFAMQFLENDVVHAGFWGDFVPQFNDLTLTTIPADTPTAAPSICLAYNATNWSTAYKNNMIGIAVQTFDDVPAGCSAVVSNKKANTAVLVVRHADTCVAGVGNCEVDTAGKLYFQASLCQSPLPATMTADGSPYILDTATFNTLHKRGCTALVTDKRKFISNIYYIRDYATTVGDGIPTLVRSQFDLSGTTLAQQTSIALIEGIEGFNVELGIDSLSDSGVAVNYTQAIIWASTTNLTSPTNRGDGSPDGTFKTCTTASPCTAADLTNVVAVKLYVLARNREATRGYNDTKTYSLGSTALGPFNDGFKRHVFSTSVRLTNVSTRRETP